MRRYQREPACFQAYKPFTRESRKLHCRPQHWGIVPPKGEGRLVPIPPRVRAVAAKPARPLLVGLALLLAATAFLIAARPAPAATPCWEKVVQDWYDDSVLDNRYPRHCYLDALRNVSEEVRTYTSFEEDVKAALQRLTRENLREPSVAGGTPTQRDADRPRLGSANEKPRQGLFKQAFDKSSPRNADSMPIPLLILGGLALLLVAAGAAGLLRRRLANRRPSAP